MPCDVLHICIERFCHKCSIFDGWSWLRHWCFKFTPPGSWFSSNNWKYFSSALLSNNVFSERKKNSGKLCIDALKKSGKLFVPLPHSFAVLIATTSKIGYLSHSPFAVVVSYLLLTISSILFHLSFMHFGCKATYTTSLLISQLDSHWCCCHSFKHRLSKSRLQGD